MEQNERLHRRLVKLSEKRRGSQRKTVRLAEALRNLIDSTADIGVVTSGPGGSRAVRKETIIRPVIYETLRCGFGESDV